MELGLSGGFWDAVTNCELLWEYYKICDALGDFCGFADDHDSAFTAFDVWCAGLSSDTFNHIAEDLQPYRFLLDHSLRPSDAFNLHEVKNLTIRAKREGVRRKMAALVNPPPK